MSTGISNFLGKNLIVFYYSHVAIFCTPSQVPLHSRFHMMELTKGVGAKETTPSPPVPLQAQLVCRFFLFGDLLLEFPYKIH